jgi:hypothetical protein
VVRKKYMLKNFWYETIALIPLGIYISNESISCN